MSRRRCEAADVAEAADLMTSTGVKSLPVVDHGHRLVGVLSRRDIVHAFARLDADVERDVNALFESLGTSWLATADEGSIVITGPVGRTSEHWPGPRPPRWQASCRSTSRRTRRDTWESRTKGHSLTLGVDGRGKG